MGKLEDSLESMRSQLGNLVYQHLIAERKKAEAEKSLDFLEGEIAKLEYAMNATNSIGCAAIAEVQETHRAQIERLEQKQPAAN